MEIFFCLAIDDLPKRLRETFVLYFEKQYSYQEIATELNISYPNVRKRISQARNILRERYEEYKRQEEIVIVESGKEENSQSRDSEAAIGEHPLVSPFERVTEGGSSRRRCNKHSSIPSEIPQEAVLSEGKSESILVETTIEEELREIETIGNGEQQLLALSVLVELLREAVAKLKAKKQQKCSRLNTSTNIVPTLGNGEPKDFSKPLKLVNYSSPEYPELNIIKNLITTRGPTHLKWCNSRGGIGV